MYESTRYTDENLKQRNVILDNKNNRKEHKFTEIDKCKYCGVEISLEKIPNEYSYELCMKVRTCPMCLDEFIYY